MPLDELFEAGAAYLGKPTQRTETTVQKAPDLSEEELRARYAQLRARLDAMLDTPTTPVGEKLDE